MNHSTPKPTHTAEPWILCDVEDDDTILNIEQDREALVDEEPSIIGSVDLAGDGIDPEIGRANAERIVACVNACAGIADPADLRRRYEALREAAQNAQCACSPAERDSGHLVGCWKPELDAVLSDSPLPPDQTRAQRDALLEAAIVALDLVAQDRDGMLRDFTVGGSGKREELNDDEREVVEVYDAAVDQLRSAIALCGEVARG